MNARSPHRDRSRVPGDIRCPQCGTAMYCQAVDGREAEWSCVMCGTLRFARDGRWQEPTADRGNEYRGRHQARGYAR